MRVAGVSKHFGRESAVRSLSFEAQQGCITGLLGPNGAGKSTVMRIITTCCIPTAGKVFVHGADTQTHPLRVRSMVGYLPEDNPLYEDMYVSEFLSFTGRLYGLGGKRLRERTQQVLIHFNLRHKRHKKIQVLSRGYKQRVGLARAFIHDPAVVILDEPTAGLDPNQLGELREVIKDMSAARTILFSTHILQEARALCDRIIVMNKGQKVMDEHIANLRDNDGIRSAASDLERLFQAVTTASQQDSD